MTTNPVTPVEASAPPIPTVHIHELTKTYGSGEDAVQAIASLTFDVYAGEVVCIVGPSGAGKTTLLKCLAGLIPTSGGTLEIDNEPVAGPSKHMALVFQDYGRSLMPWLTVARNVMLPLRGKRIPKNDIRDRVDEALTAVGLSHVAHRYPWQLSGGMQQRVAIARALAYRPDVLLMDEPFASVDAQTRMDLEDLALTIRHKFNVTMVFVTHDIDESVYVGDRVVVLSAAPTRVLHTVNVDLPTPRTQVDTKSHPRFADMRQEIMTLLGRGSRDQADSSINDQ